MNCHLHHLRLILIALTVVGLALVVLASVTALVSRRPSCRAPPAVPALSLRLTTVVLP